MWALFYLENRKLDKTEEYSIFQLFATIDEVCVNEEVVYRMKNKCLIRKVQRKSSNGYIAIYVPWRINRSINFKLLKNLTSRSKKFLNTLDRLCRILYTKFSIKQRIGKHSSELINFPISIAAIHVNSFEKSNLAARSICSRWICIASDEQSSRLTFAFIKIHLFDCPGTVTLRE